MNYSDEDIEFVEDFKSRFNDDEMSYFYHVTDINNCDSICENGILLSENRLFSTTLPIENDFMVDPIEYIKTEIRDNRARKQNGIALIGCPTKDVNELIKNNYEKLECWAENESADYVIPSYYILGYIDVNEKKIIDNESYSYDTRFYNDNNKTL